MADYTAMSSFAVVWPDQGSVPDQASNLPVLSFFLSSTIQRHEVGVSAFVSVRTSAL